MSAAIPALFAERRPFRADVRTRREARLFDRYIRSRNQYKADFIALLGESLHHGPVLELNGGFGSIGMELLSGRRFDLHIVCATEDARELAERRIRRSGMAEHCRVWQCEVPPFPFSDESFELVYSVNSVHEWKEPAALIRGAWKLLRKDGCLVINDLKRDAEPFITEYVIREMAADETEEGRFHLKTFLRTLESAYTSEEIASLVRAAGVEPFAIDAEEPMTFTVRIGKRG